MSVSIDDLKPKTFKVTVRGVELDCKPVRLRHALILAKVGNIFENAKSATESDIEQAQKEVDKVFDELLPQLAETELDMEVTMALLEQIMGQIAPDDNKELKEKGVQVDTDPKA